MYKVYRLGILDKSFDVLVLTNKIQYILDENRNTTDCFMCWTVALGICLDCVFVSNDECQRETFCLSVAMYVNPEIGGCLMSGFNVG